MIRADWGIAWISQINLVHNARKGAHVRRDVIAVSYEDSGNLSFVVWCANILTSRILFKAQLEHCLSILDFSQTHVSITNRLDVQMSGTAVFQHNDGVEWAFERFQTANWPRLYRINKHCYYLKIHVASILMHRMLKPGIKSCDLIRNYTTGQNPSLQNN